MVPIQLSDLENGGSTTALLGASVLIIIAAAVLLFALRMFRRQVVQETGGPVSGAVLAMPKQEVLANYFNTAQELSPGNGLLGNFRAGHLVQVNRNNDVRSQSTKLRWSGHSVNEFSALATKPQPLSAGQFLTQPQQTELLADSPSSFSTEPLQTERTPQFSVPAGVQLPSTPVPQQQVIPSTPTGLWQEMLEEEMTDPLLEAMMHQARAGLYIVPRREDEMH